MSRVFVAGLGAVSPAGWNVAALREALNNLNVRRHEDRHKKGYAAHPAQNNEFSAWEDEQAWGD